MLENEREQTFLDCYLFCHYLISLECRCFILPSSGLGAILQISCHKLHLVVEASDSPRPSEPCMNRNVGQLWPHNNMRTFLLFKIISQCALPNSRTTRGQYVSGQFVQLQKVVAGSISSECWSRHPTNSSGTLTCATLARECRSLFIFTMA